MIYPLDAFKRFNERGYIVPVPDISVIEPEPFEGVVSVCALRFAELPEDLVKTAVIFRYALVVVVYDNDQIAAVFTCAVQTFVSFTAGEGAVSDHGDDIFSAAGNVSAFRESQCKGYGSRRVTYYEMIVLAFRGIGESRDVLVMRRIRERELSACQDLVRITLV